MRLVLDTNLVASGLLWNGASAPLIDAAHSDQAELCIGRTLLAELARILRRAKFAEAIATSDLPLDELVLGYAELATVVTPEPISPTAIDDPDDDHVLARARRKGRLDRLGRSAFARAQDFRKHTDRDGGGGGANRYRFLKQRPSSPPPQAAGTRAETLALTKSFQRFHGSVPLVVRYPSMLRTGREPNRCLSVAVGVDIGARAVELTPHRDGVAADSGGSR